MASSVKIPELSDDEHRAFLEALYKEVPKHLTVFEAIAPVWVELRGVTASGYRWKERDLRTYFTRGVDPAIRHELATLCKDYQPIERGAPEVAHYQKGLGLAQDQERRQRFLTSVAHNPERGPLAMKFDIQMDIIPLAFTHSINLEARNRSGRDAIPNAPPIIWWWGGGTNRGAIGRWWEDKLATVSAKRPEWERLGDFHLDFRRKVFIPHENGWPYPCARAEIDIYERLVGKNAIETTHTNPDGIAVPTTFTGSPDEVLPPRPSGRPRPVASAGRLLRGQS
jgi:hypothetical protein